MMMLCREEVTHFRSYLLLTLFRDDDSDSSKYQDKRILSNDGEEALQALLKLQKTVPELWSLMSRFEDEIRSAAGDWNQDQNSCSESYDQTVAYSLAVVVYLSYFCDNRQLNFFLPQVHDHVFRLQRLLPLLHLLFERSEVPASQKGLSLFKILIQNVSDKQIPSSFYDFMRMFPIHKSLIKVMVYSSNASVRSDAKNCFQLLLNTFEPDARVKLVNILIQDPEQQASVVEFVLMQYRKYLIEDTSDFYAGQNLEHVLRNSIPACLSRGQKDVALDDISKRSDAILGLLNFIRFLCSQSSLKSAVERAKVRDRLLLPLERDVLHAKEKLADELSNISKQSSTQRSETLSQIKHMKLEIPNSSHADDVIGSCPDDFQEQGILLSSTRIDMITSVINRVKELLP